MLTTASYSSKANAQGYYDEDDFAEIITCESIKGRTNYCQLSGYGGEVVLIEQISRSDCDEGYSWGVDRRGIWVSQGCRATFGVLEDRRRRRAPGRGQPGGYGQYNNYQYEFTCESIDGRFSSCPLPARGRVQLVRQNSRAACTEGYSWGVDRRGVWVDHGCRADFAIY